MTAPSIRPLVDKLNSTCRDALEGAAAICLSRTNYHVEIEHWLLKLCEPEDTDLRKIFKHYDVDLARITQELTDVLDRLRTGNARSPDLSLEVIDLMREAWNLASLDFGDTGLRTGYLLTALLTDRQLGLRMESSSRELCRIPAEKLRQEVAALMKISAEAGPAPAGPSSGAGTPKSTGTQALDQYTLNLTERARNGQIDPVIGRGEEIRQVIDILTRRRQNNPILTGDAGVGKTAVVEGFAIRVTSGNVPAPLRNVEIRTLDLGLLQAGAGIKGEFENRLKSVIAEVKASPVPIILFIDEAHTLIGAGAAAGQGDAANLLKPALARGELRTIAATTWREYKKSFETDAALKRRFQVVKVEEPDPDRAIKMLRGLAPTLRSHHKVCILEEALEDAVKLSFRYIPDRQLPDKAVSLLDTACARVALSQSATPPLVEDTRREIEFLDAEITALKREANAGLEHAEQLEELAGRKDDAEKKLLELQKRWASEKQLVEQINTLQSELDDEFDDVNDSVDTPQRRVELQRLTEELTQLQGEQPLVHPVVDRQAVAEIVSAWTGIPIGKMVLDEIQTVLKLKDRLEERVVGQSHALEAIAQRIKTSRAAMADPRRPIGVFLLAGPSGVGKTETAMALAEVLYGGSRNMVVVNMSEYKEEHKISRLTGSAPGYVGYGEGGVLTEAVRRKPYSVVLLDEVEKAHPAVQEVFYQVFDKGTLQDDKGEEIDFRNTIILLTTNAGSDTVMRVCSDPDTRPGPEGLAAAVHEDLLKVFKPALLGRMTVVPYYPLDDEVLRTIVDMQFQRIAQRVRENHGAGFTYDDSVVTTIASRCKEVETGARNADHIITGTVLPEISRKVLSRLAEGDSIESIDVSCREDGSFVYQVSGGLESVQTPAEALTV